MITHLETDSDDYYVLSNAVKSVKGIPGIILEIGTRRGGSMKIIIDALLENQDHDRSVIGLDPYGNIEYVSSEGASVRYDYTNSMRNETFAALYAYVLDKPVNLIMQVMEDREFFKRFYDGVPLYNNFKTIVNQYALVFFDGPHDLKSTFAEMNFFLLRAVPGTMWVIDDIHVFPYQEVKDWLHARGFQMIEESTVKASFKFVGTAE